MVQLVLYFALTIQEQLFSLQESRKPVRVTNSALRYSATVHAQNSESWLQNFACNLAGCSAHHQGFLALPSWAFLAPLEFHSHGKGWPCAQTPLNCCHCAKQRFLSALDLPKVWRKVRRKYVSKYIQGEWNETVDIKLETTDEIKPILGYCWRYWNGLFWFLVVHDHGEELCSLGLCSWLPEMHVCLCASQAGS